MQLLHPDDDRAAWCDAWERTGREPFAHPSFVGLLSAPEEQPRALLLEGPDGVALVPLVLRPVPGKPSLDASSPYGYGGPYLGPEAPPPREVLLEVGRWVRETGIASAFLRLSLDVDVETGPLGPGTEVLALQQNVVVNLTRSEDRIWTDYEHKVRKNVNKARRGGCTVERSDRLEDPAEFADVYLATMSRRGAATSFRLNASFFASLGSELAGSYSVFVVRDPTGRAVSVEFVLESDRYLYSFLGGTLSEAFPLTPNDLLKHEAVLHGHRTGRRGYVLGGGYGGQDGIFRYKRSFDPAGVRDFRAARVIGDEASYAALVQRRRSVGPLAPGFFPAYRAPVVTEG